MRDDNHPSLQGIQLTRSFGEGDTTTVAVDDVSLSLYPGQMALLMGPSGSG
jgi:putative ABC transport system ATP-binding protein